MKIVQNCLLNEWILVLLGKKPNLFVRFLEESEDAKSRSIINRVTSLEQLSLAELSGE